MITGRWFHTAAFTAGLERYKRTGHTYPKPKIQEMQIAGKLVKRIVCETATQVTVIEAYIKLNQLGR